MDTDGSVFAQLFGGTVAECEDLMRLASPTTHAHPGAPPFLIVHGTLDQTVPFNQAKRLYRALVDAGAPVEFVPIEGGYHNWNPQPAPIWPKVRYFELAQIALRFFQQHL
jgi:dipeptidyl aminopeptidase/acylaminoacyl peptidase